MLLLARAAAHCCLLLLLLRSQGNKANNYRVAQLGICIAVLYMYIRTRRSRLHLYASAVAAHCAACRGARATMPHRKKRVIVPSAYCVALRRKALNHATKGAAAVDEAPYLLNTDAQRRKAKRGVARRGVAWPSMRRLRGNEKCGSFHLRRERLIYISRSLPHTLLNTRYVR